MSHYVDLLAASRWVLAIVFAAAVLDVVLPFIPAETIVVAVGVVAAETGRPQPVLVMVVAAVGVCLGDHLAYHLGRRSGALVTSRMRRGRRGAALHDWVLAVVRRHGPALLVFGRYVPGVRSATAFTAGAAGFPGRRFAVWTMIGAVVWAVQAVLLGYLGGVFAEDPLLGFGVAWLGAMALSAGAAAVQQRVAGRAVRRAAAREAAAPATARVPAP